MMIFSAVPKLVNFDVLQFDAQIFAQELAAREGGDVFQHRFATVAKAGRLDSSHVEDAANAVDN